MTNCAQLARESFSVPGGGGDGVVRGDGGEKRRGDEKERTTWVAEKRENWGWERKVMR